MANGKEITNEELAQMVAKGFEHTATKDDIANMATKDDIARLEARLDRMEGFLTGHDNRISRVEDDMRLVKTKLEI